MTRRRRVPRPGAVLSFVAAVTTVLYLVDLASLEGVAVVFGFLTILALDSIAGSLDRMSTPPRWNLPTHVDLTTSPPHSLFEASEALKARRH